MRQYASVKKNPSMEVIKGRAEKAMKLFQELGEGDYYFDSLFQELRQLYFSMNTNEKEMLFTKIINQIEVPKAELEYYLKALMKCGSDDSQWPLLLTKMRSKISSPRLKIFKKISYAPGGLKFLLDFRRDLLSIQRYSNSELFPLDADIIFLFEMWFQDGFLYLEEITHESAYNQIELIKKSDMVHPMASIEEMGHRLGRDRKCFALYHRFLPKEPIVFIEVALTYGLAKKVSEVLYQNKDRNTWGKKDTAIFYSINNTQNGLAGLGLGKMLIGKVVDSLKKENDKIRNFATLSPIPGFWEGYLMPLLQGKDDNFSMKHQDIITLFPKKSIARIMEKRGRKASELERFNEILLSILDDNTWINDTELTKILQFPMRKMAYHYIMSEKNLRGKPLNPVANFHLGNGATASIRNINFMANPSIRGLKESCGIMVNYVYSYHWFSQLKRSFRWFDKMEI